MAEYQSKYKGAQIDAGLDKAFSALQSVQTDSTVTETGSLPVTGAAVFSHVKNAVPSVDSTVTETGTNPVSGSAVKAYVDAAISAIADYEEVSF